MSYLLLGEGNTSPRFLSLETSSGRSAPIVIRSPLTIGANAMNSTMAQPTYCRRLRQGILRPNLEALESRLPLSGPGSLGPVPFSVGGGDSPADQSGQNIPVPVSFAAISSNPADGSDLTTTPSVITIGFNHPIDPWSVGAGNDLILVQVVDGQEIPFNPILVISSTVLSDDGLRMALSFTTNTGSPYVLPRGTYRVEVNPYTGLQSLDGNFLISDPNAPTTVISTFHLSEKGVTLGDATPITLQPGIVQTSTSSLDFVNNPYDVKLFKIDLPEGQTWRLGAEVFARRTGLHLDTGFSLFDVTGHLVQSDQAGNVFNPNESRAGNDPFFFVGLRPGTYYVGISSQANFGDTTAGIGYNPITGFAGSVPNNHEAGGAFRLNLVADAVGVPISVTRFQVDYADTTSSQPTGLTIGFSSAVQLSSLHADQFGQIQGLELADQDGHSWPLNAVKYDQTHATLTLLFNNPLPVGHYHLETDLNRGLVDLAGNSPVGQGGASLLGSFEVAQAGHAQPTRLEHALDFGPFLPGQASPSGTLNLSDGETQTIRVVVTVPMASYAFDTNFSDGNLTLTRTNPDGTETKLPDPLLTKFPNTTVMNLSAGVYTIHLHMTGQGTHSVAWTLKLASVSFDSLIANVVGQDSALGFRLVSMVTPTDSTPGGTFPSPWTGGSAFNSPGSFSSPSTEGHAGSTSITSSTAGVSGFFPTAANSLVGHPLNDTEHLGVVGPTTNSGSTALAFNGAGLVQGVGVGQSISERFYTGDKSLDTVNAKVVTSDDTSGAVTANEEPDHAVRSADDQVLAQVSWVDRFGNAINRWTGRRSTILSDDDPMIEGELPASEAIEPSEEGRIQTADLSAPFGIGFVAYLVTRYRHQLTKFLNRGKKIPKWGNLPGRPMGRPKRATVRF